jgi:hypothetical protein
MKAQLKSEKKSDYNLYFRYALLVIMVMSYAGLSLIVYS